MVLRYHPVQNIDCLRRLPDEHIVTSQPETLSEHILQKWLLDQFLGIKSEVAMIVTFAQLYFFPDFLEESFILEDFESAAISVCRDIGASTERAKLVGFLIRCVSRMSSIWLLTRTENLAP